MTANSTESELITIAPRRAIEKILATPTGKRMVDEIDGERIDERRRLLADLERLQAESRPDLDEINEIFKRAGAARAELERARHQLDAEEENARNRWSKLTNSVSRATNRIKNRLVETVDPQLVAFYGWLQDERNRLFRHQQNNLEGERAEAWQHAIHRRNRAIAAAMDEAESMRFEILTRTETAQAIERMRAGIPADPGDVPMAAVIADFRAARRRKN